ncbi:MAG: galactose mutarotase [Victivallaceae bacterium]|nr:galactose mutarotase [Victivallaceae bacterium]
MNIRNFFTAADGSSAKLYSLRNAAGFGADITDWGGAIVSLWVPDRSGKATDVALGYREAAVYERNPAFFGALIGRVANRISGGKFTLDGKVYTLPINDGRGRPNTLHGGNSWGRRLWMATPQGDDRLVLRITSPDCDAGFPGRVEAEVTYTFNDDNALVMEYRATTDKTTVVNLTNHCYFNLNGGADGLDCSGHTVCINADSHTEVNSLLAPTGRSIGVDGTIFDLRRGRTFEEIYAAVKNGFDDNFELGDEAGRFHADAAKVVSTKTGIGLAVSTDAPGIQFYMGGALGESPIVGKNGAVYPVCGAFCLEAQLWPDAPNQPGFPTARLEPGQTFTQKCVYCFTREK